jgi:dipeptidyl-peptidase-4
LYDVSGRLLNAVTSHTTFEAGPIVKVDERTSTVFYMARDGDNHLKLQLRRVGLDGRGDVRLTDPAFHHTIGSCTGSATSCAISPDNRYFVDTYETHRDAPAVQLVAIGEDPVVESVVAQLAASDLARLDALGVRRAEHFTYTAADGSTALLGRIVYPTTFDPHRRWPVLVSVYGGPGSSSGVPDETFVRPNPLAEYGFLMVSLSTRAAPGRGKRLLDDVYQKLGAAEIDDMAEGIKALAARPYVDAARVGIYGTSYGGYASLLMLLRHPSLVAAASASSPVTSWQHYDSIYTERYMWTPAGNKAGYDDSNAMALATNLRGRLLLYFGTADNNVHPNNSLQLIKALQSAGKSFEVQVGPDAGHTSVDTDRMMEFFIENLVMRPERLKGV